MHHLSLKECIEGLHNKSFSSVELCQHYLKRIETHDAKINAFITLCDEDKILEQARAQDENRAKNTIGSPLAGIPMAQKDIFTTQHIPTTCGSKMLEHYISPFDATTVQKFNQAGMIMLGKLNMDEFAMGSSNENSYFGPCKNPWNLDYVPGGSSGGSAAAVAARLVPGSTGTDTGGSIRQPAAFCGITGIKPTYGRVSRQGMIAFASGLDQGGPMAKSAEDCAYLLQIMAGHDPHDATSERIDVPNYMDAIQKPIRGMKIGLPKEFFNDQLDPQMAQCMEKAITELKDQGVIFQEISLPNSGYAIPTYYILAPSEASSNLSRFDGVRFGYSAENPKDLMDLYKKTRSEGFGNEVKRRILIGTFALSSSFYGSFYQKAQKVRMLIKQDFMKAFGEVDAILGPVTPSPAYKIGEKCDDPVSMYLGDIFSIPANLAGLPALSMPGGMVNDLPVGVQLIGPSFSEATLLGIAHQYQQATSWHKKVPELFSE